MLSMKRLFFFMCIGIVIFATDSKTYAQDKLNLSLDVASGFVWRGLAINTLPVVQPSFTFSPGKFSIGVWGSTTFVSDWDQPQEVDVFISYNFTPSFSINVVDYYVYNSNSFSFNKQSYFNYKKEETGHVFDLQLVYDGVIKAMVSTIIAGDDLNDNDNNNYSTYFELGYGNTSYGVDWEVFAGAVPMTSSFYGISKGGIINFGLGLSKSFEITPTYSLPLSVKFSVNPATESVWLVAAITLF